MQIGAAYLPTTKEKLEAAATTRVPVGLSAYCAAGGGSASNAQSAERLSHGSSHVPALRADNSVSTGFAMASPAGACVFNLADLQLRPVQLGARPAASAAATAAAKAAAVSPQMLYTLEWAASEAATTLAHPASEQRSSFAAGAGAWRLVVGGTSTAPLRAPKTAALKKNMDRAGAAIRQLHRVQVAASASASGSAARRVLLHSRGLPEDASRRPTGFRRSTAAGRALLRVAAQEVAATAWSSVSADDLSCAAQQAAAVPLTADAFGVACSAGLWLVPHLAAAGGAAASGVAPGGSLMPGGSSGAPMFTGMVLVTGGLGDIGFLVAMWLARSAGGGARIVLLGRSGRAAKLAAALPDMKCVISAAQCDVGSAAEVAALVARLRGEGAPPMCGIVHAGGVIMVRGSHMCSAHVDTCSDHGMQLHDAVGLKGLITRLSSQVEQGNIHEH